MKFIPLLLLVIFILGCDVSMGSSQSNSNEKLDLAISSGKMGAVKELISRKNVNSIIEPEYRWRAIHVAAYYGRDEVISYLIGEGADVNSVASGGNPTPLLIAIWKNHAKSALLLLKHGADPEMKTSAGISACVLAKRSQLPEVVAALPSCSNLGNL